MDWTKNALIICTFSLSTGKKFVKCEIILPDMNCEPSFILEEAPASSRSNNDPCVFHPIRAEELADWTCAGRNWALSLRLRPSPGQIGFGPNETNRRVFVCCTPALDETTWTSSRRRFLSVFLCEPLGSCGSLPEPTGDWGWGLPAPPVHGVSHRNGRSVHVCLVVTAPWGKMLLVSAGVLPTPRSCIVFNPNRFEEGLH